MKPGPDSRSSRHQVTAVVALTGQQRTHVDVRDAGTAEATASMTVGRALVYLRTRSAAAQLGALADRAALSVPRLPAALPLRPPQRPPAGDAQASIVTHIRGAPGGVVRLMPQAPPRGHYLHLQIGELVFHLHDRVAAHACIDALRQVAARGRQLDVTDLRQAPASRGQAPLLEGADAERARAELFPDNPYDATLAEPITAETPEATLARAQDALAIARAAFAQLDSVHRASATFRPPASGTPKPPPAAPTQRSAPTSEPPPARRPDPTPNPGRNRAP